MTSPAAPSPEQFFETVTAYQRTAALKAALELNLFTAIADGARTTAAIAAAVGAPPRGVRVLCDYLTLIGLVSKEHDTYTLTPSSAIFLSKRSPAYLGGTLEFLNSPGVVRNFDDLAGTIRNGGVSEAGNTVAVENPIWVDFARAMVPMAVPAAQAAATLLNVEAAGPIKVLDIAAGHGMYGITIAERNPAAQVVAVDWAPVLGVATEHARRAGVDARHQTIAGDAFTVEFGDGYDVALVTNFLHHFDRPTCTAFLQKVARSLKSGGRIVILEMVANDDRVSPPFAAAFALTMLAGTPAGEAYTVTELREMLGAAGFSGAAFHPTPGPQTVILATK